MLKILVKSAVIAVKNKAYMNLYEYYFWERGI